MNLSKARPSCGTPNCNNEAWIFLAGKWRCSSCVIAYREYVNKSVENMIVKEKEERNE